MNTLFSRDWYHPDNGNVGRWQATPAPVVAAVPAPDAGVLTAPAVTEPQNAAPAPAACKTFVVLPGPWVVGRTHAWVERYRRLIMHHDRKIEISTAGVWFAEACRLARRLIARAA